MAARILHARARSPSLAVSRLVRPDGSGDLPTIQAAVGASAPGDTVVLSDGPFAGPGNRDVPLSFGIVLRSESDDPARTKLSEASFTAFDVWTFEPAGIEIRGISIEGLLRRDPGAGSTEGATWGLGAPNWASAVIPFDCRDEQGRSLPAGVYFLRAGIGDELRSTNLIVVRQKSDCPDARSRGIVHGTDGSQVRLT